jgi:hypothetical protein
MKFTRTLAFLSLVGAGTLSSSPMARAQLGASTQHSAIQAYLDADANFVSWVDVDQLDLRLMQTNLEALGGRAVTGPVSGIKVAESIQKALQESQVKRIYIVASTAALLGDPSGGFAVVPTAQPSDCIKRLKQVDVLSKLAFQEVNGNVVIAVKPSGLEACTTVRDKPSTQLLEAMARCNGVHGMAISLPPSFLSTVQNLIPDGAPRQLVGAMIDMQSMNATQSKTSDTIEVQWTFGQAENASKFAALANDLVTNGLQSKTPISLLNVSGSSVTMSDQAQKEILPKLMSKAKTGAALTVSSNHLKQLALAFHNYIDRHNVFPAQSISDKAGKKLLSWRVLLLPYIEENRLFNEFRLDESWDSPHNIKLVDRMPAIFSSPYDADKPLAAKGMTRYVAPLTKNSTLGKPGKPLVFSDIKDGTSNTIWVVEAAPERAVIWTKPDDLVVDEADPGAGILVPGQNGFLGSFLDGSVLRFSSSLTKETLNALFSVDGKELIDSGKLAPND